MFSLVRPLLHALDPETAHNLTLSALELGLASGKAQADDPILATRLFGRLVPNPVGIAAGFDKNARVFRRLPRLGFGFVEIGGVTPRAQVGNPRPRLFRLPEDGAVINRMGFNNDGMEVVAERLEAGHEGVLGANLAANADSDDPVEDFAKLVSRFAPLADFLTIDISCPNTANGKMFQQPEHLARLLARLGGLFEGKARPPLVAKIAPDLTEAELDGILERLLDFGINAMTVSNTTSARPPSLQSAHAVERGGLSGRPLFEASTALLARVRRLTNGRIALIGVGGIASGADAYAKIRAGASVVQLYTGLVYEGPPLLARIKRELAALLQRDGATLDQAVGTDA